jgi:hypothetical protein
LIRIKEKVLAVLAKRMNRSRSMLARPWRHDTYWSSMRRMLPSLSQDQRTEADRYGGPIPIWDPGSGQAYLMLPVSLDRQPGTSDVAASLPSLNIYADGQTAEQALIALAVVTASYIEMFDEGVEN